MQSPDYARLYTNQATGTLNKPAMFRGLYQGIGSVIVATLPSCTSAAEVQLGSKLILDERLLIQLSRSILYNLRRHKITSP